MKVFLFLCATALMVALVVASSENDSKPDHSKPDDSKPDMPRLNFYKKFQEERGIDTDCKGNHTFNQYADCDIRCDYLPTSDCFGASFISCLACKDGYIPVDKTRIQCVKPEDCPE